MTDGDEDSASEYHLIGAAAPSEGVGAADSTGNTDGGVTPARPAPRRAHQARAPRRGRTLTIIGVVLLVAGLGSLGWVGWQYFGTNWVAHKDYGTSQQRLHKQWSESPKPKTEQQGIEMAVPGDAVALLRVPAWGPDWVVPIVKGVETDALARGVGMYPSSVAPGQIGNFAIAGHRITHGEPFARLLELAKGDKIIVETRSAIYTYELDNSPADVTVDESAGWVLDRVPGQPDAKPTRALITLTTCQDLFHSPDRSVGFGHLVDTQKKA